MKGPSDLRVTAGTGQLILCRLRATFTLWSCRATAGSIQTGGRRKTAPPEPARRRTMTESAAPTLAEVTTLSGATSANPLYPLDAPLIRVGDSGSPDPLTAAIARHITESGSVFLELPDGRLTIVLHLDGTTWIPGASDEGIRG
jgi:hypothetical protein